MAQKSGPPPIVFILGFLVLAGIGYWFFTKPPSGQQEVNGQGGQVTATPVPTTSTAPTGSTFPLPASVPAGTTVRIDGSTSMVQINDALKAGFQKQFSGSTVTTSANGSDKGILSLVTSNVDLAAVSRPLSQQEQSQGLVAVPVKIDTIAVVVGDTNPYRQGLTSAQVAGIFQGQITNWSAVGGPSAPIRVINRPPVSGTYQVFKDLILKGANFGTGSSFTTLARDETTGLLQALKTDGIGYATNTQVANQRTVRAVTIDGSTPTASNYPYKRFLYYVYKNPPNPAVQAFLGYANSSQGQQLLAAGG